MIVDTLFSLLMLANVGVIIGVIREEEELIADIKSRLGGGGWRLLLAESRRVGFFPFLVKVWRYNKIKPGLQILVASLVLEIVFSVGLQVRDSTFKADAATKIAAQDAAIRRIRRPERLVEKSEADRIALGLQRFAARKYLIIIEAPPQDTNSEQARFAAQLGYILLSAGWKTGDCSKDKTFPCLPFWEDAHDRGVILGYNSATPSDGHEAEAIADYFVNDADIQCVARPYTDVPKGLFVFQVGLR